MDGMRRVERRRFLGKTIAGAALAAFPRVLRGAEGGRGQPHIFFLLGDDLRPDGLGALGNPVVKTPHIDAIVRRGVVFRRAYCMGSMVGAVCLPSRTMLLTGKTLFRARNQPSGEDPATFTFPRAMKAAGYATLHVGKNGNSPGRVTAEFDETYDPGNAAAVADKAIDFIGRRAGSAPLCIYMAGHEPHDPQYATASAYRMYKPGDMPLPAAFAPYHPFDNGAMTIRDEMTLPWPRTPETIRRKLARYFASISYWDGEFGRVVDALKRAGQYDNTLFVIASDNGLSLGEHGLLGKQNVYEFGGMHVPLVFAGPGIAAGESRALAYLLDVFPTVCELAGVPKPGGVEGLSLASVIRSPGTAVRDALYTAYGRTQRAMTDGRWKLIRYPQIAKTQLFDRESDPHEQNDLSGAPEHAAKVKEMTQKLGALMTRCADPVELTVKESTPAAWSPEMLTPEQLTRQREETARSKALEPL